MTLWELAQTWEHEKYTVMHADEPLSFKGHQECYRSCPRCQLENWAREKAKEWDEVKSYKFQVDVARDICLDFTEEIKRMLGVPEDKTKLNLKPDPERTNSKVTGY